MSNGAKQGDPTQGQQGDPTQELVKTMLDVFRKLDREAKVTQELGPKAQEGVNKYAELSSQLAVGRLAKGTREGDAFTDICKAWSSPPGL